MWFRGYVYEMNHWNALVHGCHGLAAVQPVNHFEDHEMSGLASLLLTQPGWSLYILTKGVLSESRMISLRSSDSYLPVLE